MIINPLKVPFSGYTVESGSKGPKSPVMDHIVGVACATVKNDDVKNIFKIRIANLLAAFENEKIGGYLVTNEKNMLYFTGFIGGVMLLISKEDEAILYVSEVNYEAAKEKVKECRIKLIKREEDVDVIVADQIRSQNIIFLGFDTLKVSKYIKLKNCLKNMKLVPKADMVWNLRMGCCFIHSLLLRDWEISHMPCWNSSSRSDLYCKLFEWILEPTYFWI